MQAKMERYLKRASEPTGSSGDPFRALPDDLLLAAFQLVPEVTSTLLGPAMELQSR